METSTKIKESVETPLFCSSKPYLKPDSGTGVMLEKSIKRRW